MTIHPTVVSGKRNPTPHFPKVTIQEIDGELLIHAHCPNSLYLTVTATISDDMPGLGDVVRKQMDHSKECVGHD